MKGTVLALTGCMLLVSAVSLVCQDTLGVRDSTVRPTNERLRGLSAAIMARNIRGYARSLGDSGFVDTVYTGQVDEQRLRMCISGICRYGPLAIIQPRTHVTDSSSTTRDSGAVIARIIDGRSRPKADNAATKIVRDIDSSLQEVQPAFAFTYFGAE